MTASPVDHTGCHKNYKNYQGNKLDFKYSTWNASGNHIHLCRNTFGHIVHTVPNDLSLFRNQRQLKAEAIIGHVVLPVCNESPTSHGYFSTSNRFQDISMKYYRNITDNGVNMLKLDHNCPNIVKQTSVRTHSWHDPVTWKITVPNTNLLSWWY